MIKNLLASFCMLFFTASLFANKVDNIKTDDDVVNFLKPLSSYFNQKYSRPIIIRSNEIIVNDNNCDTLAKTWGIKNWEKIDFINDKRTDLLAVVYWENYDNFIAIDKGDNTFKLIWLNYSTFQSCELINSIKAGDNNLVVFHTSNYFVPRNGKRYQYDLQRRTDTLIYKFDDFVELNKKPSQYKIDSVIFDTGTCYGSCPQFQIKIDRLGNASYTAGYYSKKTGNFKSIIKKDNLAVIYHLINYLDIKKLKDNYAVPWTDSPTCSIKIKFSDGSVKEIKDYGEQGTFGLKYLYSLFFALCDNQDWQKV